MSRAEYPDCKSGYRVYPNKTHGFSTGYAKDRNAIL
jgi:hypothetical protein